MNEAGRRPPADPDREITSLFALRQSLPLPAAERTDDHPGRTPPGHPGLKKQMRSPARTEFVRDDGARVELERAATDWGHGASPTPSGKPHRRSIEALAANSGASVITRTARPRSRTKAKRPVSAASSGSRRRHGEGCLGDAGTEGPRGP